MRIFRCDHCGNALFFENVQCLRCGASLAFLPDRMDLCSIEPAADRPQAEGLWQRKTPRPLRRAGGATRWRLCSNHAWAQACNFAVPEHDTNPLCVSCRQTRILPDLSIPENRGRWYRIEVAKRRLFFTLARLGLVSVDPPAGQAQGPSFEFLADLPGRQVFTGHANGVITLNVAEADDDERVRRRIALHEPYRTLLGHVRHESGHYYWPILVGNAGRVDAFRALFGDERADYGQALSRHYGGAGQPANWQDRYVSAYATAHPWEDWAETWAHYLHMVDLLETAASYSTRVEVPGQGHAEEMDDPFEGGQTDFDELVAQWVPLTLLVNSLTRSLGQDDAYPFALSQGAIEKLRFAHDVIQAG
ncbi:MAG TPA: putative zinc-binding peptidase [Ramlibacter sp.]|nr:putative zinc-binding peptidase [Ramlibacter sp.]